MVDSVENFSLRDLQFCLFFLSHQVNRDISLFSFIVLGLLIIGFFLQSHLEFADSGVQLHPSPQTCKVKPEVKLCVVLCKV